MNMSEKKSAQIIAIDSRKARSSDEPATLKPNRSGYRMADYCFLTAADVPSEVVISPTIFPVPKAPEWLVGLANVRGNIVPVFDLWKFLRTQAPQREMLTVLVLGQGETAVGLIIDNLPTPVPLNSQPVTTPPPAPALQPFIGLGLHAFDCEWWEFDHQKFLACLSEVDAR